MCLRLSTQLLRTCVGMVRQSEVQKLEDEARELTTTVSEQILDLKHQKMELEELRCRTPRPAWQHLHEGMHAAGALSPAGLAEASLQHTSSQLAEQLSNRLIEHAKSLQVCSIRQQLATAMESRYPHVSAVLYLTAASSFNMYCHTFCLTWLHHCRYLQQQRATCVACLLLIPQPQQPPQLGACVCRQATWREPLCSTRMARTPVSLEYLEQLIRHVLSFFTAL